MAVYSCPKCRVILTCRPPENRERQYCFPHSDEFVGCDRCGVMYCGECSRQFGEECPECGGAIHANRQFQPTGIYRLSPGLRRLPTAEGRINKVQELWNRGIITQGEREFLLRVIAELGDDEDVTDG